MKTFGSGQPLDIKVLFTEACPGAPKAIQLVEEVVAGMGMPVRLERIVVESPEQARAQRFLGSPTVQVNGLDVDPAVRNSTAYGFT